MWSADKQIHILQDNQIENVYVYTGQHRYLWEVKDMREGINRANLKELLTKKSGVTLPRLTP